MCELAFRMIFLKYKQPKAEYVQFQRFVLGITTLTAVLFQMTEFVYLFLALSIISFITTMNYSPSTLLFKLLSLIMGRTLYTTAPQYAHSYITNRLAEIFEDILRMAGGTAILYLHGVSPLSAWMMTSFMSIAMLISSMFGFCLSSLVYIAYKKIMKPKDQAND